MSAASKPPDPLDSAEQHLDGAARATDLLEYSADFDEPTGRHEVHVHVPPQPSQPDIERPSSVPAPAKGIRAILGGINGWPQVIALAILVAGLLAAYWLKTR